MKIGIFDSGIGGLTVAKEIVKAVPGADIVYVGDTARVPYGPRSKTVIIQYAKEIVGYLLKKKVDIIVVACNSVSSVAIPDIKKMAGKIPVIDMIGPAVDEALNLTKNKRIAIVGTTATINSGAYKKAIEKEDKIIKVFQKACPLFVPIVEEGLAGTNIANLAIKMYINDKSIDNVDTIILACTHYPLLLNQIKKFIRKDVIVVTCGAPAAQRVKSLVHTSGSRKGKWEFFVTDDPEKFSWQAGKFFGKDINIKKISLG